jgi:hypothetical protein
VCPLVSSFYASQRGAWVFKVSGQCKCWCIGHSCFSQKAFRALPFPLFPSSWEWFINWPSTRKEAGLRSQAFDLHEEKGHSESKCEGFRAGATGIETGQRRWVRGGDGGIEWAFRKVKSIFLRDSGSADSWGQRSYLCLIPWACYSNICLLRVFREQAWGPSLLTSFHERGQAQRLGVSIKVCVWLNDCSQSLVHDLLVSPHFFL